MSLVIVIPMLVKANCFQSREKQKLHKTAKFLDYITQQKITKPTRRISKHLENTQQTKFQSPFPLQTQMRELRPRPNLIHQIPISK